MARRLSFSFSSSSPSSSSSSSSFSSSSSSSSSSSGNRAIAAAGFKPYLPSLRTASSSWSKNDIGGDRFIPVRLPGSRGSYLPITKNMKAKTKAAADDDDATPSQLAYRRALADAAGVRDRVLTFRTRPLACPGPLQEEEMLRPPVVGVARPKQRWRVPKAPSMSFEIIDIQNDLNLNLLDWGSANVLAVALEDIVMLWDHSNNSSSILGSLDALDFPVTSLCWAPDGRRIAVGLESSQVQLWDSVSGRMLRALSDPQRGYLETSLAWKDDNILATGGINGDIRLHDLRLESPVVQTFRGHTGEVCGLKWSGSGQQLASGGVDQLLHIWDVSMSASTADQNSWLHRMHGHTSTVKALAWCPFQSNLLASGGGREDCLIKFWNTSTGRLLNSVDAGSEVCSLQWSRHQRQLISSHGGLNNQLVVWKYPSMAKARELTGHSDRVLFTAQSPDGYTLASASADESLMFWNFFDDFQAPKPKVPKSNSSTFSGCSLSYIR